MITSDATGLEELVDKKRGKVIPRNQQSMLAAAILDMVSITAREANQYRSACIEYARSYPTWENTARQVIDLINIV